MTIKKTETKTIEERKEEAQKIADTIVPKSAGALLEAARKADTRAEADAQTNKTTDPNEVNIVKQLDPETEAQLTAKQKPISDAEYERRTKLDVSDANYINPSLEHGK